jgi:hypothetical protein
MLPDRLIYVSWVVFEARTGAARCRRVGFPTCPSFRFPHSICDGAGPVVTEQAPFVTLVYAAALMNFPAVFSIRDGTPPIVTDLCRRPPQYVGRPSRSAQAGVPPSGGFHFSLFTFHRFRSLSLRAPKKLKFRTDPSLRSPPSQADVPGRPKPSRKFSDHLSFSSRTKKLALHTSRRPPSFPGQIR